MSELPPSAQRIAADLKRAVTLAGNVEERVRQLLETLHQLVPYEGLTLQVLDAERREFGLLGSHGYGERTLKYLTGRGFYQELELVGMDRNRPPMCLRDIPVPLSDLASWFDHLEPAGFREGVGVTLFSPDGRHLGYLSMNTDTTAHPTDAARDFLGVLAPLIADLVDPMQSVVVMSRMVGDAQAGVVLTQAGDGRPLPGLPTHPLLRSGSSLLAAAMESLGDGRVHSYFLCPYQPPEKPETHLRVTVLPCCLPTAPHLVAVVLLSPAGNLRGLTRRELEILGLLVVGWSNQRIANALVIAPRTVAAHVEHSLTKLDAPTRTLAAVRALRLGLYVPRSLIRMRQER